MTQPDLRAQRPEPEPPRPARARDLRHARRSPRSRPCAGRRPVGRPIEFRQTNSEAQLIDWIHEAIDRAAGIVINPAAWSFTSIAILDALKMFEGPIIELHISNIHRREEIYQRSLMSRAATAVIAGLGAKGYVVAIHAVVDLLGGETGASAGAKGPKAA